MYFKYFISKCTNYIYIYIYNTYIYYRNSITYSPTDFQLLPIRGLPCRRDNILVLFFVNNRSYLFACLSYSSQSWYRDAPLYPPSVCQISRKSDMAFAFYSSFCKCVKRGRKIRRKKKTKQLSQCLKSHTSGTCEAISLKFGMWSAEVGGHVHSKIRLVSSR